MFKTFSEDLCLSQDLANEWDPDGGYSMCKGIKRKDNFPEHESGAQCRKK